MLDWSKYITVADTYQHKAKSQDKDDLRQDIIVTLAEAQRAKDNNGGGQLSPAAMYRIASYQVADYWRNHYKLNNGLDCGSCSQRQRRYCRLHWSYSDCPKALKVESLSKPIMDSEGSITELGELIADDKAIELDQWTDIKTFLLGCPQRLIEIANKRSKGQNLTATDSQYLWRFRKREQKNLIPV